MDVDEEQWRRDEEYVAEEKVFHVEEDGGSVAGGDWQPPPPSVASASIEMTAPLKKRLAPASKGKWRDVQAPKLDASGKQAALWQETMKTVGEKTNKSLIIGGIDCLALVKRLEDCWIIKSQPTAGGPAERPSSSRHSTRHSSGRSAVASKAGGQAVSIAGSASTPESELSPAERQIVQRCKQLAQEIAHADKTFESPEQYIEAIFERPWSQLQRSEEWRKAWCEVSSKERAIALERTEAIAMAVKRALRIETAFEKLAKAETEIAEAVAREGGIGDLALSAGLLTGAAPAEGKATGQSLVDACAKKVQSSFRGFRTRQRLGELKALELAELEAGLAADPDKSKFANRDLVALDVQAGKRAAEKLELLFTEERAAKLDEEERRQQTQRRSGPLSLRLKAGMEVALLASGQEMGIVQQHMGVAFELYLTKLWRALSHLRAEITRADPTSLFVDFEKDLKELPSFQETDGRVARKELEEFLCAFSPSLSRYERELVVVYLDSNVDGLIKVSRIVDAIRGGLSDRRLRLVSHAFDNAYFWTNKKAQSLDGRLDKLREFYKQFAPDELARGKPLELHRKYQDTEAVNKDLFKKLYAKYVPWLEPPEYVWSSKATRQEQERIVQATREQVDTLYSNVMPMVGSGASAIERALESLRGAKDVSEFDDEKKSSKKAAKGNNAEEGTLRLRRTDWIAFHAELSAGIASDAAFEEVVSKASNVGAEEWEQLSEELARRALRSKDGARWLGLVRAGEQAKLEQLRKALSAENFERYSRDLQEVLRKVRACIVTVAGADRKLPQLEKELCKSESFGDDRKVSYKDFKAGLSRFGVVLTREEMSILQTHYDNNGSGYVVIDAFLEGIRESERRRSEGSRTANESKSVEEQNRRRKRWLRSMASTILPEAAKEWVRYEHTDPSSMEARPFWYCKVTGERTWRKPEHFSRHDKEHWEKESKKRVKWALGELKKYREAAEKELDVQLDVLRSSVNTALPVMNASLRRIPATVLSCPHVRRLTTLVLDHNNLEQFPPGVADLAALRRLSLAGNALEGLPAMDLAAEDSCYKHLVSLRLSNNKIKTLPKSLCCMTALRELELDQNLLQVIPAEAIQGLQLHALNLENNRIRSLPGDAAAWASLGARLQWLSLRNNQLATVPAAVGEQLGALAWLDLQDNRIGELPSTFGQGLTACRKLQLQGNNLLSLPAPIGNAQALETLLLQHNALTRLPEEVCSLQALRELKVNNNRLVGLPERIGELRALELLHAQSNRLDKLPASFGGLGSLAVCWLHQNELTTLPLALPSTSLKVLKLHNNRITALPDSLGQCEQLNQLDLAGNQLVNIPISLCALSGLGFLRLDENPLEPVLAKVVRTGRFSTPEEKNYGLLLRKLIDSIKDSMDLQGRIDTALGVSVEQAMRESMHAVRERLQAAKEVKLGINNRKAAIAAVSSGDLPGSADAATRSELEAALEDHSLRKGRSIVQQALSLSLKRFSEAAGGSALEISVKSFHACITVIGSFLSSAEVDRLTARVFQIFDPKESGKIVFDLFVVSIQDAVRSSLGQSSANIESADKKSTPLPLDTESLDPNAVFAVEAPVYVGRHGAVAAAVVRFCSAQRVKLAESTLEKLGMGKKAGDGTSRLRPQRPKSASPSNTANGAFHRKTAEMELTELSLLAERDAELNKELSQLQHELQVSTERAKLVQDYERLDSHLKSGTSANPRSPRQPAQAQQQPGSPTSAPGSPRHGKSAAQLEKTALRAALREKNRQIQETKRALLQQRAVARYYNEDIAQEWSEVKAKEARRKNKQSTQNKLERMSQEERLALKEKKEKLFKIKAIFADHSRPLAGSAARRQVLHKGDMIAAAGDLYRQFGHGRWGLEPREWREKLLATVDEAFTDGFHDAKSGRYIPFDKDGSGFLDINGWVNLALELERRIIEDFRRQLAAEQGHSDGPLSAAAVQLSPSPSQQDRRQVGGESADSASGGVTVLVDFVATIEKVIPISLKSLHQTAGSLKAKIAFSEAIPVSSQILLFNGKRLDDAITLHQAKVSANSKIKLVLATA